MERTIAKLNELATLRAMLEASKKEMEVKIEALLTPEIIEERTKILNDYGRMIEGLQESIGDRERAIKMDTLEHGETVRGATLMAVWNKGRTSWDTKGLSGYAVAHPEILAFQKNGKPSVSIRVRK